MPSEAHGSHGPWASAFLPRRGQKTENPLTCFAPRFRMWGWRAREVTTAARPAACRGRHTTLRKIKVRLMLKKLHKMLSRIKGAPTAGSGRSHRGPRRCRPGVESLEGRLVPATIKVTTFADVVNPI